KGNLKTIKEVRNFVYSHEGKIGYIYWDNGDSDFESYNVDRSEYPVTIIIRFDEGYLYSVFPHHQEAVVSKNIEEIPNTNEYQLKGIVNIEKPGYYEKRALKRIKTGDTRCGGKGVCWEVVKLRPFTILVHSGGKRYEANSTKREFLEFGEQIK
nr:hypothetical protein [Candidatus Omnitrophota bacterium]